MPKPKKYIKRSNVNFNPSNSAFNELSKAAGKIVPRAANVARNVGQLALPVPGPKKFVAGAKVARAAVKAVKGKKKVTKTSRGSSLPIPGMGVKSRAERNRVTNSKFDERITNIEKDLKQAIKEGKSSFQINKFRGELRKVKVQQRSFNQMYNKGKR